ncbi:hypothetical protein V8E55_005034 [Tylopilus felleus]
MELNANKNFLESYRRRRYGSLLHYKPCTRPSVLKTLKFSTAPLLTSTVDLMTRSQLVSDHSFQLTFNVTATFELSGMKTDDVTIDVHQNRLTVVGEARNDHS